ncbi:hypothetical protein EYF80_063914 [Liparis tanakae]|uniref:Uncharacterized protein n=1 Tax=Liparis tanakae TaxID=230148 RepID=A0A4Z2EBK6_9TELE|nr:hypothetical protein EYF80_063914 [Liparis tanakae]
MESHSHSTSTHGRNASLLCNSFKLKPFSSKPLEAVRSERCSNSATVWPSRAPPCGRAEHHRVAEQSATVWPSRVSLRGGGWPVSRDASI